MVHRGNPAVREWVGANRDKIRDAVYKLYDVCWLDGKPVDWDADPRSRWAPSVDHVVPRSRGGDPFDLDNCRLAHLGCNARRGNRPARPHVSTRTEFPTRPW
jgi:5-methylcytosine-specific restriction endonuclease McrA